LQINLLLDTYFELKFIQDIAIGIIRYIFV